MPSSTSPCALPSAASPTTGGSSSTLRATGIAARPRFTAPPTGRSTEALRLRPSGRAGADAAAPERKVVHLYLRERTEVETHSEGDEPERRLVVTPLRAGD